MRHEGGNLIYALSNGKLVSVEDVPAGLKCDCFCPACGEQLVAKKGQKMTHHFAHKAGTNCAFGYQTSLHLLAKDILANARRMVIPELYLRSEKCLIILVNLRIEYPFLVFTVAKKNF